MQSSIHVDTPTRPGLVVCSRVEGAMRLAAAAEKLVNSPPHIDLSGIVPPSTVLDVHAACMRTLRTDLAPELLTDVLRRIPLCRCGYTPYSRHWREGVLGSLR